MKEHDPRTWFVSWQPHERRLWRQYLAKYVPGDRLACYRFIAWQSACEPEDGDPPPDAEAAAYHAAHLADLFKATKWRKR